MIRRCEFQRALDLVHRSGVHRDLEALLRPEGKGGRGRMLGVDVFLAGALMTFSTQGALSLVNIHKVLTREIARSLQVELGVRKGLSVISIRQVRYLLEAIEAKLAYTEGRAPKLDKADREERRAALQSVMDKLLGATIPKHLPQHGSYAVDASAIESAARGKRRPSDPSGNERDAAELPEGDVSDDEIAAVAGETGYSFDPDARWGYRTRTYDNKTTSCFGYQMIAYTRIAPVGWPDRLPLQTERITVIPANGSSVEPAIAILDRLFAEGRAVIELAVDRGFSYATPERWADPLRVRDVEQVLDLHANDYGARDFEGVKMVAGMPHCPAMPDELDDIRRPAQLSPGRLKPKATPRERLEHAQRVAALAEFNQKIAAREIYAFQRHVGPDATGKERWKCPAQVGKVICDNCPLSKLLPAGTPKIENPPPLETAPKACKQTAITVPGDVTPKLRQRLRWGSPEWIESYNRRSRVEGGFGNLKSSKTENVRRGWTHVVGIVKTSLMLVIAQTASNLRLLRGWAQRVSDYTDPLTRPDPPDYGFEELGSNTSGVGNTDPPAAA